MDFNILTTSHGHFRTDRQWKQWSRKGIVQVFTHSDSYIKRDSATTIHHRFSLTQTAAAKGIVQQQFTTCFHSLRQLHQKRQCNNSLHAFTHSEGCHPRQRWTQRSDRRNEVPCLHTPCRPDSYGGRPRYTSPRL